MEPLINLKIRQNAFNVDKNMQSIQNLSNIKPKNNTNNIENSPISTRKKLKSLNINAKTSPSSLSPI